jgi:hypothetical protein
MMMNDHSVFMMMEKPCDEAVEWLSQMASRAGLSVLRTFDLQMARQAQMVCPCPHHGTDQCDCQMVVLLLYQGSSAPLAMVAHGYEGQTWFSVVDTPQQHADPHLVAAIRTILAAQVNAAATCEHVNQTAYLPHHSPPPHGDS